ncbi:hypothetical protein D3C76_1817940 [compost metagenome]
MLAYIDLLARHQLNTVPGCSFIVDADGAAHQGHPHRIFEMADAEQRAQHADLRDTGIDAERAYESSGHIEQCLPGLQLHPP